MEVINVGTAEGGDRQEPGAGEQEGKKNPGAGKKFKLRKATEVAVTLSSEEDDVRGQQACEAGTRRLNAEGRAERHGDSPVDQEWKEGDKADKLTQAKTMKPDESEPAARTAGVHVKDAGCKTSSITRGSEGKEAQAAKDEGLAPAHSLASCERHADTDGGHAQPSSGAKSAKKTFRRPARTPSRHKLPDAEATLPPLKPPEKMQDDTPRGGSKGRGLAHDDAAAGSGCASSARVSADVRGGARRDIDDERSDKMKGEEKLGKLDGVLASAGPPSALPKKKSRSSHSSLTAQANGKTPTPSKASQGQRSDLSIRSEAPCDGTKSGPKPSLCSTAGAGAEVQSDAQEADPAEPQAQEHEVKEETDPVDRVASTNAVNGKAERQQPLEQHQKGHAHRSPAPKKKSSREKIPQDKIAEEGSDRTGGAQPAAGPAMAAIGASCKNSGFTETDEHLWRIRVIADWMVDHQDNLDKEKSGGR